MEIDKNNMDKEIQEDINQELDASGFGMIEEEKSIKQIINKIDPYKNEIFKDDIEEIEKKKRDIEKKFSETEREDKSRRIDKFFKEHNFDAKELQKKFQFQETKPKYKLELFVLGYQILEHEMTYADGEYKNKCEDLMGLVKSIKKEITVLNNNINNDLIPSRWDFDVLDLINKYGEIISSFILFIFDRTSVLKKYSYESDNIYDTGV